MEVENGDVFFWNRDWRENIWKLFVEGWAGRWTGITLRGPWTQTTFYLIVSGLKNVFSCPNLREADI